MCGCESKRAWSGLSEPVKKWFWSHHRLNTANRTWHCRTISQLPFDMHIDTNAQNCNFLSEFVSLRGSLSCQWIVRCAALSPFLPLSISLSRSLSPTLLHYAYMSVSRKRISPLTAVKCTNQMEEAYKENMVEKMFF